MSLQEKIEKAWDNRELLKEEEYQNAVREVVAKLDAGELRTAEPTKRLADQRMGKKRSRNVFPNPENGNHRSWSV